MRGIFVTFSLGLDPLPGGLCSGRLLGLSGSPLLAEVVLPVTQSTNEALLRHCGGNRVRLRGRAGGRDNCRQAARTCCVLVGMLAEWAEDSDSACDLNDCDGLAHLSFYLGGWF